MSDRSADLRSIQQSIIDMIRRVRTWTAEASREIHPELEGGAFSLMTRIREDQPARASDLAKAFGLSKPTMSRQLAVLEKLGLIDRITDPADARSAQIRLSPEGEQRWSRVAQAGEARMHADFESWSDEEVALMAEQLAKLVERHPGS